ncbi:hypothetical protein ER308_11815 [Egibacter rhizosphaerae]|uniref:Uncharacterized protein n=1 Tax=Egibacter rhizosphaerae TaxID=1670831 RepID=A0A411YGH5_9ACTN|nr:hypothetical protein [Egibacter rhizosphaerae]QBI20182.1 hypothetical protein ER308_11815 [Egibacter rhizosphaerae]
MSDSAHERGEQAREVTRAAFAKALSSTAAGLSAAAKALQSTAQQLRPPDDDAASAKGRPSAGTTTEPPKPPSSPGSTAPDASGSADAASSTSPAASSSKIESLAEKPVRALLGELDALKPSELRALRQAENASKQRKTVLDAIDRKLGSA